MDLQKICRICLKSDLLVSIFSPTFLLRPIEMIEKLNIFKVDDSLTKFLCQSCLYHIIHITKELSQLQQMAQASERQMRDYLRCNPNFKPNTMAAAMTTLQMMEPTKALTFSTEASNFCDIFRNSVVEENATDDMLNDVEIDVSSLTRSEADDTLSEVFVDAQINCHYETDARDFAEEISINNAAEMNNAETAFKHASKTESINAPIVTARSDSLEKQMLKLLKTPEKCLECGKIFKTFGYLAKHQRKHTGEKPFKCKLCERQFSYQSNLQLHEQTHDQDKRRRFQCEICANFFTTSSNLKAHRLIHKNARNFQCEKCMKCFKSARELRRHEPIHHINKTHRCDQCEKKFHKSCYLNAHISAVHQNKRKYQCQDCKKVFATSSNLKSHARVHSGEKPFQCKECVWKFSQSSALMRHVQKKHQSTTNYENEKIISEEFKMPPPALPITDKTEQRIPSMQINRADHFMNFHVEHT